MSAAAAAAAIGSGSASAAATANEDKEQSSSAITSLYKSRVHLLSLLKQQGYSVANYEGASMHEVHTMVKHNQLDMLVSTTKDDTVSHQVSGAMVGGGSSSGHRIGAKTAYIKYAMKKLQQKDVHNIIDDLFILDQVLTVDDVLIIVAKHAINETITQLLNQLWSQSGYFIIVFSLDQLQFNVLEHQYVPVHEIMDDEETKRVIRQYNITNYDQLPNISRYDPVAQAIGIRPGQICKITRPSKTSIISYYYRVCT